MDKEIILIIAVIAVLLFTVSIILIILTIKRLNRTEKRLQEVNQLLSQTRKTITSGNMTFDSVEQEEVFKSIIERIDKLEEKQKTNFDRVDIVRYFASDKDEGRSSYSIGLTNAKKDGLILTALMYRNGMNLYAKHVSDGVSDVPLSEEEKEAVSRSKVTKIIG